MKNVLLFVPTESYRARSFIEAAKKIGVKVTVASQRKQALSSRIGDGALVVALDDPRKALAQVLEASKTTRFDAIVSVDDLGLASAALVASTLGLKHVSAASARLTQNKFAMRTSLTSSCLRQPQFMLYQDQSPDLDKLESVDFPLVVKPVGLAGSVGVVRVDRPSDLDSAIKLTSAIQVNHGCDRDSPVLLEQYIDGAEYAVEGVVIDEVMHVMAIFSKPHPLVGPYFGETIYVTPPGFDSQTRRNVIDTVETARVHLGIDTGPIHAEVRVTPEGDVYLIEIAARSIGGMCSKAVPLAGDVTLEELILSEALGAKGVSTQLEKQASGVYMMPVTNQGRICSIRGVASAKKIRWITNVEIIITLDSEVRPIPFESRYLGFIFAKAPSTNEVVRALENSYAEIEMEIN